jgi:hypothetical protein
VAIETEKQVIAPFCEQKHNGRPAGNWNAPKTDPWLRNPAASPPASVV